MASCDTCKNAYIEDIWWTYVCKKTSNIRYGEDTMTLSDEEFDCSYYEVEEDYRDEK